MKLKYQRSYLLIPLYFIYTLNSCKKFIEVDKPTDRILSGTLFDDESTATAAVLGLYGRLQNTTAPFSNGATAIYCGLASDELVYTSTDISTNQFYENNIAVDNGIVLTNFWRNAYEIIYQSNACIDGLNTTDKLQDTIRLQLLAESYFIRAFSYWYLVNLFGDVPLVLTTNYQENSKIPRLSQNLVKENILKDLMTAKSLLKATYPSVGKVRVNYYTVLSLLNRFYLYEKNWVEVDKIASEIIQSGIYKCEADIDKVFLAGNTESIWELLSSSSLFNTVLGNRYIPSTTASAKPNFILSGNLLALFEEHDLRKSKWIVVKRITQIDYFYPFKYKVRANAIKTENYIMFRLGEIYLNRAEARAHLGNTQGAVEDINVLRGRAGLSGITVNTPDLNVTIQKERYIELFSEWGDRWFDLKRTGKVDEILSKVKSKWQSTDDLFPIPSAEILTNINLTQNSGYNK
ncbi:hypothetical protein BAY13_17115 [Elizabethkingia bruuniana]|uniref:RagB/SusD family nutrient uptake outer membrane protein n=1 Tax=Elizabethkingia bruuniana TaxID=1756149 RepID=UPI00099AC569|nr:RagB/SusD family nutrient uptake outer membrane protein [Elizabethkingia bruuniana]OPC66455.1 hypothetical protein BAY13_17115 [Elizabethkingia bruuniana]